MKTLEFKDMKFNAYNIENVDDTLLELLYELSTNKAEIRFDFGDNRGLIDYTSYKYDTYKGQLTKQSNGYSEIYATKRASQTDKYAIDSVMKVYIKENKKYRLVFTNAKLKEVEYVIKEGTSPDGYLYAELYARTDLGEQHITGKFGENAKKDMEKAILFYKGEIHRL